jgi:copper ion binding protein
MNPKKPLSFWSLGALASVALIGTGVWASRAAATAADEAPLVTSEFRVEGMTCGGCEASVKMTVGRLDGVRSVEASHEEKRATVTYDETRVTPETIVQAIEKLGYTAELVETKPSAKKPESTGWLARLRACC